MKIKKIEKFLIFRTLKKGNKSLKRIQIKMMFSTPPPVVRSLTIFVVTSDGIDIELNIAHSRALIGTIGI